MKKTLREIHKELGVKQTLKIYVNNTNKKYRTNYTADEILSNPVYEVIRFNTMGKLRMHRKQVSEKMQDLNKLGTAEMYKEQAQRLQKSQKLASKILEKENLKDAYIKTLKEYAHFGMIHSYYDRKQIKRTADYLKEIGVKYGEYMSTDGLNRAFQDRIKWFEQELSKKG